MSNASPRQEMNTPQASGGRYRTSEEMLDEALKIIPLGSQTFSKSLTQYPRGVSPFFIQRGDGSVVWDVDGNSYTEPPRVFRRQF